MRAIRRTPRSACPGRRSKSVDVAAARQQARARGALPFLGSFTALLVVVTPVMAKLSAGGDLAALLRARRTALLTMAGVGLVVLIAVPLSTRRYQRQT